MKLTVFSTTTLPGKRGLGKRKGASISFGKTGMINFSGAAIALMGLKNGDQVSLAQDDADPEKWYFFKDPDGFTLKSTKGGLWMSHKELVTTYVGAFDADVTKSHKVVVTPEPVLIGMKKTAVEYWLLEFQAPELT
jgi:hypothetical protein